MSVSAVGIPAPDQPVSPVFELTPGGPFGIYIHVPFCASRCGYCDFNTYTPGELGGFTPAGWLAALRTELELAAARLPGPAVDTVFIGGGTPSLLGGSGLADVLDAIRSVFTITDGAEITTEANPESTSPEFFERIADAGYTRVSLGMQSVAPAVLRVLDRTHSPGRAPAAVKEARAAGLRHISIDLIYGTPGETDDDVRRSVETAVLGGIDHLSAYALVVEDGTALARRVRRGEVIPVDDDVLAYRYELIDDLLATLGFDWYEVSNWSKPGGECRHNLGYWNGGQWWGAGPGAHGFIGSTRWWNIKRPNAYADLLADRTLPVAGFETLDVADRHTEDVLLRVRLRAGLPVQLLTADERTRAEEVVADELLAHHGDRLVLTDRGRLLADGVVRRILG